MILLINIVFAWITVILMVLLLSIYVLRTIIQKSKVPKESWIRTLNRKLRTPHKWLGVIALISGFIHGLYSSVAILTTNKGTILWVLFIVLGLTFMLRKQMKSLQPWIQIHRIVATATILFLFLHLVEVDWFVGIETIVMSVNRDLESAKALREAEALASSKLSERTFDSLLMSLKDGVYRGEATGYRPGLVVDVTVNNHRINFVEVVDHNEVKKAFWGLPVIEIPLSIVENQSIEVDVISGATMTSYGIINAVEDAMMNGVIELELAGITTDINAAEVKNVEEEEATVIQDINSGVLEKTDNEELFDTVVTDEDQSATTIKSELEVVDEEFDETVVQEEIVADVEASDSSTAETKVDHDESQIEAIVHETTETIVEVIEIDTPLDVEEDSSIREEVTEDVTTVIIEVVEETTLETQVEETVEAVEEVIEVVVADVVDEVVVEEVIVEEIIEEDNGSIYNDGLYIGTADGFRPNLVVEVVIHEGLIFIVEVIDHNEKKERYWGKPVEEIPIAIIQNQSTDIDVVSGATYTSNGIMDAADDALKKALK